ncbi:MAG: hypothetical protein ACTSU2_09535 [Promethearchaeota archaeon]
MDNIIIDDVGSFPLPQNIDIKKYETYYWKAYKIIADSGKSDNDEIIKIINEKIFGDEELKANLVGVIKSAFEYKLKAGLDVINYPQHIDMWSQFLKPMEDYEEEPFLIYESKARVLEVDILNAMAKEYYEEKGEPLKVKSCVSGPMELYLKKMGFGVYKDIALNIAKSVNHFLKNSIINNKYIRTTTLSIDEPSIGYVTFNQITNDDVTEILSKSAEGLKSVSSSGHELDVQIHLHSLNASEVALKASGINILTCEYASDQKNIIPKKDLDDYDKFIRVGIARTNLGGIIADEIDKGRDAKQFTTEEALLGLVDSEERIISRLKEAVERYDDRLKYVGPDCGLRSWDYQKVAAKVLENTVKAVKKYQNDTL